MIERDHKLFLINSLGTGSLGFIAMVTALLRDAGLSGLFADVDVLVMPPICFVIGGVAGIVSLPFILLGFKRADLRFAVPFVFLPSVILVIWYTTTVPRGQYFPFGSAVPAIASVSVLSIVARFVYPRVVELAPGDCRACGYSLHNRAPDSTRCPECGATV